MGAKRELSWGAPRRACACLIVAVLLAAPGSAAARPEGATDAELDAMSDEELEAELLSIERELASVHHELFVLAMAARDPRAAGLALAAWRTHQAIAQRLSPHAPCDHRLAARVALHARALAIEGRVPRGLAADTRAFARELARLEAAA